MAPVSDHPNSGEEGPDDTDYQYTITIDDLTEDKKKLDLSKYPKSWVKKYELLKRKCRKNQNKNTKLCRKWKEVHW